MKGLGTKEMPMSEENNLLEDAMSVNRTCAFESEVFSMQA